MLKTLERYQNCSSYGTVLDAGQSGKDLEQSTYRECLKLKTNTSLYNNIKARHLFGEDLGPLNITDLEHLELQLDSSLTRIRSTKFMLDQLSHLRSKERMLLEANKALEGKLHGIYSEYHQFRPSWAGGEESSSYGHHNQQQHAQSQSQAFFQPLDSNSSLQIGYNPVGSDQIASMNGQNSNTLIPGWML